MLSMEFFTDFRQYVIAKRLQPMVERVNKELPALLSEWRRGLRQREA